MKINLFDNKKIQGFMLREKRKFVMHDAASFVEPGPRAHALVAAILADIAQLGFTFDGPATNALYKYDAEQLALLHLDLVENLKVLVGANVKYRPLFRAFPDDVPDDFTYFVAKLVNLLSTNFGWGRENSTILSCGHVISPQVFNLHAFSGCPICQHSIPELEADKPYVLPLQELTPLKVLGLGSYSDVLLAFDNVVASRTSISDSYKEFLREVVALTPVEASGRLPEAIPFKENVGLVVAVMLQAGAPGSDLRKYIKTPTDALRAAVGLSNGDLSLAEACKFKLTSPARRFIMEALEKLPQGSDAMLEEMVAYTGRWLRLGEVLHVRQFAHRYPKLATCFTVLRNNPESVRTFESRVAELFEKSHLAATEADQLLALLAQRPGEFARKLDTLLQRGGLEQSRVLGRFGELMPAVSTNILLTLVAHFRTRGETAPFRAFMPKGSVARMFITEQDTRHTLDLGTRSAVMDLARGELLKRFALKPSLGRVFISDQLDKVLLPASQRSASTGLVTVPRGSRLSYDTSKNTLRLFIHWMETPETDRIDVDLTAGLYNDNWEMIDQLSWTNASSMGNCVHSGDVRSAPAPHGAAEFIDIDVKAALAGDRYRAPVRYVLMQVYSWTGQPFSDFPAFAGVMEREDARAGDHFEAATVSKKFDLSSPVTKVAPLAVDLLTGEVLWMDMALAGGSGGRIETSGDRMTAMAKAIQAMSKSRASLYDLFELHAASRGVQVESAEEADTVLDMSQLLALDDIAANWL